VRKSGNRLLYIIIGTIVLVVVLTGSNMRRIFFLQDKVSEYERKIEELENENRKLAEKLKWIDEEEDYIKQTAREKLGLVKPGEYKYYIIKSTEGD